MSNIFRYEFTQEELDYLKDALTRNDLRGALLNFVEFKRPNVSARELLEVWMPLALCLQLHEQDKDRQAVLREHRMKSTRSFDVP